MFARKSKTNGARNAAEPRERRHIKGILSWSLCKVLPVITARCSTLRRKNNKQQTNQQTHRSREDFCPPNSGFTRTAEGWCLKIPFYVRILYTRYLEKYHSQKHIVPIIQFLWSEQTGDHWGCKQTWGSQSPWIEKCTYILYVCVCVCVGLEVLQKVHDPLALGLFELVALPVPDTLSKLCQRKKKQQPVESQPLWPVSIAPLQKNHSAQKDGDTGVTALNLHSK